MIDATAEETLTSQPRCSFKYGQLVERLDELLGDEPHRETARRLRMSNETVRRYRQGRNLPSCLFLQKLAEKQDVNLNWLLLGKGEPTKELDRRKVLNEASVAELLGAASQRWRSIEARNLQANSRLDVLEAERAMRSRCSELPPIQRSSVAQRALQLG